MNELVNDIGRGLDAYLRIGAQVKILGSERFSVPRIFLPPFRENGQARRSVVFLSGQHLEETSGPQVLLNATDFLPLVTPILGAGIGIGIYPIVNQRGLSFSPDADPELLRHDVSGQEFNSGWRDNLSPPQEEALVGEDLLQLHQSWPIILIITLHEDYTEPQTGYMWINNLPPATRRRFRQRIDANWGKKHLLKRPERSIFFGGRIEGPLVVDAADDAWENYFADQLDIPAVTIEAPFGLTEELRLRFQRQIIKSLLEVIGSGIWG